MIAQYVHFTVENDCLFCAHMSSVIGKALQDRSEVGEGFLEKSTRNKKVIDKVDDLTMIEEIAKNAIECLACC